MPPVGFENIRVRSAYGGGARGNQPVGAVADFLVSVPRISDLQNITPMGGGTDLMDMNRLERLGNRRIRHRGRAVGDSMQAPGSQGCRYLWLWRGGSAYRQAYPLQECGHPRKEWQQAHPPPGIPEPVRPGGR